MIFNRRQQGGANPCLLQTGSEIRGQRFTYHFRNDNRLTMLTDFQRIGGVRCCKGSSGIKRLVRYVYVNVRYRLLFRIISRDTKTRI